MKLPDRKNILVQQKISMGRHLVYSEGTKTEPFYVENIAKHLPFDLARKNILIPKKYSKTKHTVELIERAQNDVAKERKKGNTVNGVWIMFDKDSFADFDEACMAIESKNSKMNDDGYLGDEFGTIWYCCFSNECFELWPYLHFEDLNAALPRDDYIKKINAFIKKRGNKETYAKNKKQLYDFLKRSGGDIDKAIKFAKRKDAGTKKKKENPSTGLYQFVQFFKYYFDK